MKLSSENSRTMNYIPSPLLSLFIIILISRNCGANLRCYICYSSFDTSCDRSFNEDTSNKQLCLPGSNYCMVKKKNNNNLFI
jgi:hypothetical protein